MVTSHDQCVINREYAWSKNGDKFFLKMLYSEQVVDIKHKPPEDKKVMEDCRTPGVVNAGKVDVLKI